jgi:hypothetical protein
VTDRQPTVAEIRERTSKAAQRVRRHPDPTDPEWRAALDELGELLDLAAKVDPNFPIATEPDPSERTRQLEEHLALARQFRIPCTNKTGGYAEITVEQGNDDSGRWAVTDGSFTGRRAWLHDGWVTIYEVGWAAVCLHSRDTAIEIARQVAAIEGAGIDAHVARLIAAQESAL